MKLKLDDHRVSLGIMVVMIVVLIAGLVMESLALAVIAMILSLVLIGLFVQQVIKSKKEKQDDQQS